MFVELSGEVFKVLKKEADGNWLISYENPSSPVFVMEKEMNRMNRIEPPAEYQKNCMQTERTPGLRKRREMVAELLADESFITDKEKRRAKVREIAEREHCTTKRIRSLYFKSLAGRPLIEERAKVQKEVPQSKKVSFGLSRHFIIQPKNSPFAALMICFFFPDIQMQTDT